MPPHSLMARTIMYLEGLLIGSLKLEPTPLWLPKLEPEGCNREISVSTFRNRPENRRSLLHAVRQRARRPSQVSFGTTPSGGSANTISCRRAAPPRRAHVCSAALQWKVSQPPSRCSILPHIPWHDSALPVFLPHLLAAGVAAARYAHLALLFHLELTTLLLCPSMLFMALPVV